MANPLSDLTACHCQVRAWARRTIFKSASTAVSLVAFLVGLRSVLCNVVQHFRTVCVMEDKECRLCIMPACYLCVYILMWKSSVVYHRCDLEFIENILG